MTSTLPSVVQKPDCGYPLSQEITVEAITTDGELSVVTSAVKFAWPDGEDAQIIVDTDILELAETESLIQVTTTTGEEAHSFV